MKYKVGDIVKVRDDLEVLVMYGEETVIEDMLEHKGKYVTIERINNQSVYKIKEDDLIWDWTDEMFENIDNEWFDTKSKLELNGIVLDANYEYQKIVKINPTALHYENEGEQPYIKYVCPICQSLGIRLQLEKGKSNCSICNVNLNWDLEDEYE